MCIFNEYTEMYRTCLLIFVKNWFMIRQRISRSEITCIYLWYRERCFASPFRVLKQTSFMKSWFVRCKRNPGPEIHKIYLWWRALWLVKIFLDLNVFPHSWQGNESPSKCVSMWFSRFHFALAGFLPTASFLQIEHLDLPSSSVSMYCCTVFLALLISSEETEATIFSTVANSLDFWVFLLLWQD